MPYVSTRLGRWYYEERGKPASEAASRTAIVLLHGLLFDGAMWTNQVGPLAELGRVVVFDGPGHGKSEVPPPFSLDDHARALTDALDALGIDRALLVGLSWGGMLGMRVAVEYPSRVVALALLDTSANEEAKGNRVKYRALASFARRFGMPRALYDRQIAPLLFADKTRREQPELVERWGRIMAGFSREGLSRAAKAVVVKRTSVARDLRSINAPTLVVCGKEDRATPPAQSQVLAQGIARSRLVLLDGVGHSSVLEDPKAVNHELVPFVKEHLGS